MWNVLEDGTSMAGMVHSFLFKKKVKHFESFELLLLLEFYFKNTRFDIKSSIIPIDDYYGMEM